jgi:hypothetical protein
VFTARYGLIPCITQIRFFLKTLNIGSHKTYSVLKYIKNGVRWMVVFSLWCIKVFFCNNKQIIGSWNEIKIKVYYSLKVSILSWIMLRYSNICIWFLESQVIAHDVKPEFVNVFVYAEFRVVNVDISLSLVRVYFIYIDGCLIYLGVNRSFYVPR